MRFFLVFKHSQTWGFAQLRVAGMSSVCGIGFKSFQKGTGCSRDTPAIIVPVSTSCWANAGCSSQDSQLGKNLPAQRGLDSRSEGSRKHF